MARFVRVKEVAKYTQLKERTIRSYVLRNIIPHIKVNGSLVFDLDVIDTWMKENSKALPKVNEQEGTDENR